MSKKDIQKPTRAKGTRDFGPAQMARRNYLLKTISGVFKKFGFMPLETPAMENLSVLTGKYGDEGDQLLFKILNSGDYLGKVENGIAEETSWSLLPQISEKGLRYDLTVPFARYVVMNRNEINFPFRRYQIQPVWRADRPQKGRYREFLQCDADVIGTDSLLCEAEIIMMLNEIFTNLKLDGIEITINSRKLLTGLSEYLGQPNKEAALCVAIDKLDKIGQAKVYEELQTQGFDPVALEKLTPILELTGTNLEKIDLLKAKLNNNETCQAGIKEVEETLDLVNRMNGSLAKVSFNPSLARGLSYYTGMIFEVRMLDGSIGSISGGGRYDNLTGVFGMPDVSGVGISLGVERIYDVLEERDLFPQAVNLATEVMFVNFGEENEAYVLPLLAALRAANVRAECYPDNAKMKKQMTYANRNMIPYVVIAGQNEASQGTITIKNMNTGEQDEIVASSLTEYLTK